MQQGCTVEELSHTAEIGLRMWAPALTELYACAVAGMVQLVDAEFDERAPATTASVTVMSRDLDGLLVDWLNELLFLQETTGVYWRQIDIDSLVQRDDGVTLSATVRGWPLLRPPRLYIKAVTYHQLHVVAAEGGWRAEVYFDV